MGDYGDTGSVRFHREPEIFVVTFAPEKHGKKEFAWERPRLCSLPPHSPRCARMSAKLGNETTQ